MAGGARRQSQILENVKLLSWPLEPGCRVCDEDRCSVVKMLTVIIVQSSAVLQYCLVLYGNTACMIYGV